MEPTDTPRRTASALTWLLAWWSRLIAGLALANVAAVAGIISYTHIDALTLALHQSPLTGHLMPFGVDGLIIVGSMVLLTATGRQAWWGWLGVAPGVAGSLFANWESGIAHGRLAAFWAMVPAVAFALATFMFERWLKAQVSAGGQGGEATTEDALRALLGTDTERGLAEALGLDRTTVQRWKRQLVRAVPEPSLNGSGAHA